MNLFGATIFITMSNSCIMFFWHRLRLRMKALNTLIFIHYCRLIFIGYIYWFMNCLLGTTLLLRAIRYEVSFLMLLCLAIDDRCCVCRISMFNNTLRTYSSHNLHLLSSILSFIIRIFVHLWGASFNFDLDIAFSNFDVSPKLPTTCNDFRWLYAYW
jgi:hypothetical protein